MSVRLCSHQEAKSVLVANTSVALTAREIRMSYPQPQLYTLLITNRAKKKKYPDGYPGDAPSANTSIPIKYACHKCNKTFPPVPHPSTPEGVAFKQGQAPECTRCKHPLCSECPRAPPAKVEPSPDPEVLKSVQAKLAALNISTPVVASGA